MYKLTVLLVLFVYCFVVESGSIGGQFHYESQNGGGGGGDGGGLLSGFGSFSGTINLPSLSSGLETIAGGVRDIISTTREAVEKLAQPVSVEFGAQFGAQSNERVNGELEYSGNSNVHNEQTGRYNEYGNNGRPEYNPGNSNVNNAQIGQFNGNQNARPEYNPGNSNNANAQHATDSYPNYEIPNQNNDDGFNGAHANTDNPHKNNHRNQKGGDGEVVMYIDNHFPVILLKENEIR